MPAADAGGGGFAVVPAALGSTAARVRATSVAAREAGASGASHACLETGAPQLDAVLETFDSRWSTTVARLAEAGEDLATALSSASAAYLQTDACVVPGATP